MELTDDQIKEGLDKAYKEAGHNAYFGNGFEAGVRFVMEHINGAGYRELIEEYNKLHVGAMTGHCEILAGRRMLDDIMQMEEEEALNRKLAESGLEFTSPISITPKLPKKLFDLAEDTTEIKVYSNTELIKSMKSSSCSFIKLGDSLRKAKSKSEPKPHSRKNNKKYQFQGVSEGPGKINRSKSKRKKKKK